MPALDERAAAERKPQCHAIVYALGKIGPDAAAAEPVLSGLLTSPDANLALVSAWALAQIHPAPAEIAAKTLPVLTAGLKNPLPLGRQGAAEGLGSFGSGGPGRGSGPPAMPPGRGQGGSCRGRKGHRIDRRRRGRAEVNSMDSEPAPLQTGVPAAKRWSRRRQIVAIVVGLLLLYGAAAYIVMPLDWRRYVRRHPALDDIPDITHTKTGIPGDPLNVALIGTETDVKRIMLAARWYPADPLTLRSCLKIASATVLKRPYDDAPVSNCISLGGRKIWRSSSRWATTLASDTTSASGAPKDRPRRPARLGRLGHVRPARRLQSYDRTDHAPYRARRGRRARSSFRYAATDGRSFGGLCRGPFPQDLGRP